MINLFIELSNQSVDAYSVLWDYCEQNNLSLGDMYVPISWMIIPKNHPGFGSSVSGCNDININRSYWSASGALRRVLAISDGFRSC